MWWKVTDVTPPSGLDRNCLMNLVMTDSSLVVCAESGDDMRYEIWNFDSYVVAEFSMSAFAAVWSTD